MTTVSEINRMGSRIESWLRIPMRRFHKEQVPMRPKYTEIAKLLGMDVEE